LNLLVDDKKTRTIRFTRPFAPFIIEFANGSSAGAASLMVSPSSKRLIDGFGRLWAQAGDQSGVQVADEVCPP